MKNILVTGGAGYIGSHTCLELLQAGHRVVVVDNLVNSKEAALQRVQELAGREMAFYQVDLLDRPALQAVLDAEPIDVVMHFAGFKAVGESVERPCSYYRNNVGGTLNLLQAMREHGVRDIVFSSSATVYGQPEQMPIREDFPLAPLNPYGHSKRFVEQILQDQQRADPRWNAAILRYFNPVGAHPSGRIGEDPQGTPTNLFPYIAQVLVGRRPFLRVWGDDYATPDGSGVRDYIHVVDLALGHLHALDKLAERPGVVIYNLGTGRGHSVLEVLAAFERAAGQSIPYRIMERRPGDAAVSYTDPARAQAELGWTAQRDLLAMCADSWRWQSNNPNGY
ncbi:MAG: UDP-glucose 4-epimerase GalE [Chloroflexia bacterium]|nr:UDP-glucose 4-epimerase GalE [Chloroflexia bacterium]